MRDLKNMKKRSRILSISVIVITVSILFITACEKDDPTPEAASIELVSGNEQTAEVLATLANPVVILVKDQNDDAIAGTTVNFTVSEGSVSNATVTTDANGNASVIWTLGGTIGTQTLEATVEGLTGSPVVFSAIGNQIIVTDIDGNTYNTIQIGNQLWMTENLKTTHYANGTEIQLVESLTDWNALGYTDKAMCYYDNSTINKDTYGALYTWAAAMNGANSGSSNPSNVQGVCPSGWHIPSDAEWTKLTDYLGGTGKMKETGTNHWASPNIGATNESGFTALPGGFRYAYGGFRGLSYGAHFWSATEFSDVAAWNRILYYDGSEVDQYGNPKDAGFSVRCTKD